MPTPTPSDIREVMITQLRELLVVATPYINDALIRGARDFLTNDKIIIDLRSVYRTEDAKDKFILSSYLRDYSVDSNIHHASARKFIEVIAEEYKKHGWTITSTQRSYNLTFEEKDGYVGEDDSGETSRSELLDFEE